MAENGLQTTNNTNNNNDLMVVVKNEPLLYYPELKDADVVCSAILDDLEKKVLLATLNHPKIRTLDITRGEAGQPNTPVYNELVEIIGLAIWTMGITEKSMTQQEQMLFIPIAVEEIKTFKNLSIEDVRIAFNRGARRKYGDTLQMSITTVNIWLTKYTDETKRPVMLRLPHVKPKELESKQLSEEEKLKIHKVWMDSVYQGFDEYKKTNKYTYYDFGNRLYIYLKKLGLISLDENQQQKIWDMAVKELKKEHHPTNGRYWGSKIDLKAIYDALKLDEVDKKTEDLIIVRARKITVRYFFLKLIREAKHIRDIIEDAEKKLAK